MCSASVPPPETHWHPDILGTDYSATTIPLGEDPNGEGEIVVTLVRYSPGQSTSSSAFHDRPAVLWIHGMTDYFFHTHVAEELHNRGYAVYGVDLHKCGRSWREGQVWHYATDLSSYFPDLTAASDIIAAAHPDITPIAHSTGGLIAPMWLDHLRTTDPARHSRINSLVLNSPWLDMMYPPLAVRIARPLINLVGSRRPRLTLPGDNLGVYGTSIHREHHGEWDFDTTFKPVAGHRKYLGWLRAIMSGQRDVHKGHVDAGVDVLTLCSSRSWTGRSYSAASDTADAVLDVQQIQKWAPSLAESVTVRTIDGARHDIYLSLRHAREEAITLTVDWLNSHHNMA